MSYNINDLYPLEQKVRRQKCKFTQSEIWDKTWAIFNPGQKAKRQIYSISDLQILDLKPDFNNFYPFPLDKRKIYSIWELQIWDLRSDMNCFSNPSQKSIFESETFRSEILDQTSTVFTPPPPPPPPPKGKKSVSLSKTSRSKIRYHPLSQDKM